MKGFLLINKPKDITSYDVIRYIKKLIPPNKIGHSGTLDPFATGLMIIAIGKEYTKQLAQLLNYDKSYQAEITLGTNTDSYDVDGTTTYSHQDKITLTEKEINHVLDLFKGTIMQAPPIFSAKKVNGTPAYKLARQGISATLEKNKVTFHDITITDFSNNNPPIINLFVHCSKGTYIRSLAYDIGQKLNVGAFLSNLTRLSIGKVTIEQSIKLNDLSSENIKSSLVSTLP